MLEHPNQTDHVETKATSPLILKLKALVRSKYGTSTLATIAVVESLLPLPILTDPFLVTAVLIDRKRVLKLVLVTTVSSVIGGVLAFIIAWYFRDVLFSVLSPDVAITLQRFIAQDQSTFLLTIIGAITPVPYTIVAWAVALSGGNLLVFTVASIIGRCVRYGIVGWCSYTFGPTALSYAKRSILLTSAVLLILVGLYIWLKL